MELTLETIRAAHARIAPYIVQTPLLRLPALDDALGCEVYAKAECMQRTGAFKLRGAMNKILALTEDERARGFVAAPTGRRRSPDWLQSLFCRRPRAGLLPHRSGCS